MKKTVFLVFFGLMSSIVFAGHFNSKNSKPLTSADVGLAMDSDWLYYFTGDTLRLICNKVGGNALAVKEEAISFLYVAKDQVLELQGGPGDSILAGGAGIKVPESSTLYILGCGKVVSTGGAAGVGTQGMMGLPGLMSRQNDFYFGGIGGFGGSGGGGAGAGIGTDGGEGGTGGFPAICWPMEIDSVYGGREGNDGGDSDSSESGGKVYIVGTVDVTAHGGVTHSHVDEPSLGFLSFKNVHLAYERGYDEVTGGGGAGGNGNNGLPGMKFGGGGQGAAGAGSGGSGGVATVRDLDFKYVMQQAKVFFTSYTFTKLSVWVLRIPVIPIHISFEEIPLLNEYQKGISFYISGSVIARTLDMLLHADSHPYQFNGGGGQGSYMEGCGAPQVNGHSFWYQDMKFEDGLRRKQHLHFAKGGEMGEFGSQGKLTDLKRSWLATANQQMDVFTQKTYPIELKNALTFDMQFDTANVDITKPYKKELMKIVFSDTLPKQIVKPQPREDAVFLGYADSAGVYWYDQNAQAINNAVDSLGKGMALYLSPGDVKLTPRWSKYTYVKVNHWIEGTGPNVWTNNDEFSIKFTQTFKGKAGSVFTAQAEILPDFTPVKSSDTLTLKEKGENVINLFYKRLQSTLAWSIPSYAKILDPVLHYTPAGMVRCGATIAAPQYAVDKTTGGFYRLYDWRIQGDTARRFDGVMPNQSVTYVPKIDSIPATISFFNNDLMGKVVKKPTWLGTNLDIEVQPNEGYELDTCYVIFSTSKGHQYLPILQTANNKLTLYATPLVDSAMVWVRYRGIKHQMNYQESSLPRYGSMTWYIDGDSIGNDNGISGAHEVRTGSVVWVYPQPASVGSNVCKGVQVTTQSGNNVDVTFEERYNAFNHYDMHYSFVMPDEDVNVVSTYGTLSDELVNLRVLCDSGKVSVYSTRGRLLDNKILATTGYKVDAGQLVWVEVDNKVRPDSVRLRYYDGSTCTYEPIRQSLFVKTMQDISQPIDTTKAATLFPKYMFRMPSMVKEATIEIHYHSNSAWEEEPTDLMELIDSGMNPKAIYDIYGRYCGTQTEGLPAGIYLRCGKKFIIH